MTLMSTASADWTLISLCSGFWVIIMQITSFWSLIQVVLSKTSLAIIDSLKEIWSFGAIGNLISTNKFYSPQNKFKKREEYFVFMNSQLKGLWKCLWLFYGWLWIFIFGHSLINLLKNIFLLMPSKSHTSNTLVGLVW